MSKSSGSTFFAYIARLRWIKRWSLMRNAIPEDVAVHSWDVATIAHVLGHIHNDLSDTQVDANLLATIGLYHDATEVITGDMPTPVKYHSKAIQQAYKDVEEEAQHELLALLPQKLQSAFEPILLEDHWSPDTTLLIKAADRLSALLKCRAELRAGNQEFQHAHTEILQRLLDMKAPAVDYFLEHFAPAYEKTLDHLLETPKS